MSAPPPDGPGPGRVLMDVFPALCLAIPTPQALTLPPLASYSTALPYPPGAHAVERARVIVFERRILVAVDSGAAGQPPRLVFSDTPTEFALTPRSARTKALPAPDSRIRTPGKVLVFRHHDTCGCGSRLRSWNPYRVLGSSKDPSE